MILNNENYYSPEANQEYMSVSQYKAFMNCEAAAMASISGRYERPTTRAWVIAFADLWWQLEQHLECWCVQREPEQSTFQLEHEHRLPLRSTLICQNRKLQGLPTVRGDKGTCFHSG